MADRLKLAVNHAIAGVEHYIAAQGMQPGDELPSIQALASEVRVSRVTMWAALTALKGRGRITGVAGHPFHVGPARVSVTAVPSREDSLLKSRTLPSQSTAWKRARHKIEREILAGTYPPGVVLPSIKELENRYGVAYKSLRKALASLTDDGIVERHKRGYAVIPFAGLGRRARIIWITHSFDSFTMHLSQHDEELYRSLERQCQTARISLDVFLIFPESYAPDAEEHHLLRERMTGRVFEIDELARLDNSVILGFILMVSGEPRVLEGKLLHALAPVKRPVAILDETAAWSLPRDFAASRFMRIFTMTATPEPARRVARYLLSLGHSRIAFISPYHHYAWSRRRLEGLHSVYAEIGHADAVTAFVDAREYAVDKEEQSALAPVKRAYETVRDSLSPAERIDLDADISRMEEVTIVKSWTRAWLYDLLDRALAAPESRRATAWVAVNDETAFMALEFLAAKGVNVPGELSVASFDDAVDALRLNVTSYNFNAAGVATAMLGYILNRRPFSHGRGTRIKEIEGFIMSRQTTGPAPKPKPQRRMTSRNVNGSPGGERS